MASEENLQEYMCLLSLLKLSFTLALSYVIPEIESNHSIE
jgi:hypothetical protein